MYFYIFREATSFNVFDNSIPRTRRFSASFTSHGSVSILGPRLTPRVNQLRQEECVDVAGREVAHEREIHSAMQMSQSWEDLTLVTGALSCKSDAVTDPLHVNLPAAAPPVCSSPSPTRTGISRFASPIFHGCLSFRRSLSPIALRPSSLGVAKRKFELEDEKDSNYLSPPAKRPSCGAVGGLPASQRLSPLPGSLSSVGTPESLSSADSPGFFRPLDSPSPQQNALSPSQSSLSHVDEPMNEEHHKQTATSTA
ncbi:UNVERIFIED_CONTAM: hypothetical protein PYX00_006585 [Menopon gallinae]|uniref:Protein FAM122A n=1 Tax=Menopon gallinae TaxID=328185 RepID=A0AAW2HVW2_9NEOP